MRAPVYFISDLTYKVKDLIRCNAKRFILFCVAFVLGLIFGFRNGIKVELCLQAFSNGNSLIYLYIAEKINVFTFILLNLLSAAVLCAIICFCSVHSLTSYLITLLLFYRTYVFAYRMILLITVFKLTVLPYLLLCFLLFQLAYIVIFAFIGLFAGEISDCGRKGFYFGNVSECACRLLPAYILLALLCIAEGILTMILTFGIVI